MRKNVETVRPVAKVKMVMPVEEDIDGHVPSWLAQLSAKYMPEDWWFITAVSQTYRLTILCVTSTQNRNKTS